MSICDVIVPYLKCTIKEGGYTTTTKTVFILAPTDKKKTRIPEGYFLRIYRKHPVKYLNKSALGIKQGLFCVPFRIANSLYYDSLYQYS
jgi:hypothetical protein